MPHEHDSTQSLLRAALYLGVFMLLGAGVFARYVGPEAARGQRWRLWYMLSTGFLLSVAASLYGVYHLTWMLGDTSLAGSYLLETRPGQYTLARLVLLVCLLALSLGWFRWDRWIYPWLGLGLMITVSVTGHAGSASALRLLADLLHLGFGVVWAGGLLALAVVWPGTRFEPVVRAIRRLSKLGLVSVALVSLMGGYLSWHMLGGLANLWSSVYGQRLLLKLALVVLVLGLAAVNRFWLMPRLAAKRTRGLHTVSLEALLIFGVLLASGYLSTTEPPPTPGQATPNLINIAEASGDRKFVGQLFSQARFIHLYLDLRDAEGGLLEEGPTIRLRAELGAEVLEERLPPFYKSQYHFALLARKPGDWKIELELPEKTLEYILNVGR